ncbi:MAG: tetratricopeptide repeat protein [Pseudomonadota bacterium]
MGPVRDKRVRGTYETCPSCGFTQVTGAECPRCGLVLAKFLTPNQRSELSARHAASIEKTSNRRPLLLALIGVAAVALILTGILVTRVILDRDPRFLGSWLQGAAGHELAHTLQSTSPQIMVVYFDQPGCVRCREFAASVLGDAQALKAIESALKVHVRVQPDSAEVPLSVRYQVTVFPALFVVAGDARREVPVEIEVEGRVRLRTAAELVAALAEAQQMQAAPLAIAAGTRALEAKQYAQALAEFERALGTDPDLAEGYRGRALARLALGDGNKALADFVRWSKLDDKNPEALMLVATTALELGRSDEASTTLTRLIALEPGYQKGRAYQLRAAIAVKSGDFTTALEDARRACEMGNAEGCRVLKDNRAAQEQKGRSPRRSRRR